MTDTQTPEQIWVSEIGWGLESVGDLVALGFAWSIEHGKNPKAFVPADFHASVVAERDQLKAKLERVTKRLALKARDLSQDARNHKAERVLVEIVQELEKHRA